MKKLNFGLLSQAYSEMYSVYIVTYILLKMSMCWIVELNLKDKLVYKHLT